MINASELHESLVVQESIVPASKAWLVPCQQACMERKRRAHRHTHTQRKRERERLSFTKPTLTHKQQHALCRQKACLSNS